MGVIIGHVMKQTKGKWPGPEKFVSMMAALKG